MRKALHVEDVGSHNEGGFLSRQSRHFLLIYREGRQQIPDRLIWCGNHPGGFSFESLFPGGLRIRLATPCLLGEVPEAFFPLPMGFVHLFLHLLLCCL
jgi:hypothetical protein